MVAQASAKAKTNDWNERESKQAENTWGHKRPQYTLDMFEFLHSNTESFLDLGCGFGRFLEYLKEVREEPNYVGYDSSLSMTSRIIERFPEYILQVFHRELTQPITHSQSGVLISAVLIHLHTKDQETILNNILSTKPKALTFDINCPGEGEIDRLKIKQTDHYERLIKTTKDGLVNFRMTWQSHHEMTRKIITMFPNYNLTIKFYTIRANQKKVVYFLEVK